VPGEYLYRTAITRLRVSEEGAERLERLIDAWRVGCATATDIAWPDIDDAQALQSAAYDRVRESSGLKSEHAILVCRQVAKALRSIDARRQRGQQVSKPVFRSPTVTYGHRTMTLFEDDWVSLTTLDERAACRLVLPSDDDGYQQQYLECDAWEPTESTLTRRDGAYYLHLGFRRPAPPTESPEHRTVLGVDLGIEHLAVTSTARFFSGRAFAHEQRELLKRERDLQRTGTRSAYRTLRRLKSRYRRRARDRLHRVANDILDEAIGHDCTTIAFEDLRGIRENDTAVTAVHRWAFCTLTTFVEYRARGRGLAVEYVDPSHTSIACSRVGCDSVDSANRSERGQFRCRECGYDVQADYNAARNVGLRCVRSGHTSSERTGVGQCALNSGTLGPDGFAGKSSVP
jgi:IS605 OrfB family transposase